MIISKIKGNTILTFSGCLDIIGYFIALILFWVIVIILFSLFMGWFLEDPEGHIMNGMHSIQLWLES